MKNFYPNRFFDKKEDVPFQEYYKQGYRSIIFDIDNTLVPHGAPADEKVIIFIQQLKEIGFQICLLSNNDEERVASFNERIQVHYIYKANKPFRSGYERAMDILGTGLKNTLFVGDQIFTDVWGARRMGIFSILLDPIDPKEEIQIILKRIPEKYFKWNYRRKNHLGTHGYDSQA